MSTPPRRLQVEREGSNQELHVSRPALKRRYNDCRYCRKDHPLRKCHRFRGLSATKRLKVVRKFRYCTNCLAHSHQLRNCRSSEKCKVCFAKHHTLLHDSSSGQSYKKKQNQGQPRNDHVSKNLTNSTGSTSTSRAATIIINVNSIP